MRRRTAVLLVLGGLSGVLAGGLLYARPLLETGTGYAAHNACAVALLAGRGGAAAADDLPPNPLVPFLRTSVDQSAGSASSSVVGLFGQTAWYTDGLGCTLADERPALEPPAPVATDDRLPVALDPRLDAVVDRAFSPGERGGGQRGTRAVVVLHDGQLVAERYAEGFDADTRQLGWSMAKSVTSAMVGRLVMQGQVDLAEAALLPQWREDERAEITVEDLLRMSSGLAWDETYGLGTPVTQMLYASPDMGGYAAAQPLESEPGTVQEYSSGTTNVLCDVLQQRTGLGTDLAHELVLAPLGMSSAVLEPDAEGGLVCSSYLWATPRDWARFGQLWLQEGRWDGEQLLDPTFVRWSTTPVELAGEDEGHAAHWWVNRRPDGSLHEPRTPADAYWASGHDGQRLVVVPSAGVVVVRLGFDPTLTVDELGVDRLVADVVDVLGAG
jgi:CubicO group peptidase (beta-lactamase class C family)